jgi:ribosome biogenesis SPOUT family RNA methylase Rps3
MMIRTVRGHVILTEDAAGQTTVMVGTNVIDGEVQNVWVRHVGPRKVSVDPTLRFADGRTGRHSLDVAEVTVNETNAVNIRRVAAADDLRAQI